MYDRKIGICINPFVSHLLPLVDLIKELICKYEVNLIAFEESKEMLISFGFIRNTIIIQRSSYNYFKNNKSNTLILEIQEELESIIKKQSIDILMFHVSRFSTYFIPAYNSNVKIILYSTNCGCDKFNLCEPMNTSSYIPKNNMIDVFPSVYSWIRRFIRKEVLNVSKYEISYIKKLFLISKKNHIKLCYGIDGFYLDYPRIVLGTQHFEFNIKNKENFMYTGIKIYPNIRKNNEKKIIYCTFGTKTYRYRKIKKFYKALFEGLENENVKIVVSLGQVSKKIDIERIPDNVVVYDYIDPKDILVRADLVINHGGHGTIKECISYGVPMVVFPCSYDQHGNAARVEYLNVGKSSDLMKRDFIERITGKSFKNITASKVKCIVMEVLNNPNYYQELNKLRLKIQKEEEFFKLIKNLSCSFEDDNA